MNRKYRYEDDVPCYDFDGDVILWPILIGPQFPRRIAVSYHRQQTSLVTSRNHFQWKVLAIDVNQRHPDNNAVQTSLSRREILVRPQTKVSVRHLQLASHDVHNLAARDENVAPAKVVAQKLNDSGVVYELVDIELPPKGRRSLS